MNNPLNLLGDIMAISQDEFFKALRILRENDVMWSSITPECFTFDWEDEAEKASQLLTGFDIEIKAEPPIKQVASKKKESNGVAIGLRDILSILKWW